MGFTQPFTMCQLSKSKLFVQNFQKGVCCSLYSITQPQEIAGMSLDDFPKRIDAVADIWPMVVLPPQCRRQSIVDQVRIWFCCYSFVVYGNMWIPLVWSFLWRLFIVELVFPVIVVIWVVPLDVAVSWAPCFEWGKTCFFMIGKNQVSSFLLELV